MHNFCKDPNGMSSVRSGTQNFFGRNDSRSEGEANPMIDKIITPSCENYWYCYYSDNLMQVTT